LQKNATFSSLRCFTIKNSIRIMKMTTLKREKISAYSHGLMIPFLLAGTIILAYMSRDNTYTQLASLVYGLSAMFLFTASFLYHVKKKSENETSVWRKLDHIAIFTLIAGTYTPICTLYLEGWMKTAILTSQWILVLSGIAFTLVFLKAPRIIGTSIYLLMGWIVAIPINVLYKKMPESVFSLMVIGGIFYTVGALIYALKKPNFFNRRFGFHEIFHFFIIGGAASQYFMLYRAIN